ncbi:hypothetical protein TGVEG_241300 [Toxoplasma gondii VEG]|uniref:Transmembrane protein n=1 Tax=Toxoplasma gondii (strain ATCC 50861 / VEG) TaxID=432359 RepID=V4Z803_TOXGV|nr:hypothetical protein TGVEG_241300 [Toxoplasma gondii VEG]
MASGEMMHITTKLSILISFQCVLCTFLPERVTAQAMLKPARDPEGARGVGSSSVSMSQASSVVGTQARWLAEGSPGEEPDPVRELLDLEEELQDLLALRYRERQRFRHCAATDPETLKQMFEQKREEKEAACNVWAALLDALSEKIDAMDNERKAMQKRLTQMQFEQYLAAAAAPSRAAAGGEGSRFSSGEAADSASKSQPPGGAEGTPGDAGSVEALDRELARVRQQIKLAAKKSICCRVKLKKHLEHKPPSPTEGLFVREQLAGRAWEARRLQLEQNAEQGRETADQLRKQLQVLKQRKAAYEKAHGSSPGATGCEHAPLRFARLGITVDEREASKMWFQRPNFICLSHCSSSGPTDPAGLPRHEPRHNVFLARRQHVSRPSRKPGSKRGRSRAAEGSGKTGDEHKASTSTSGLAGPSEFQNERVHCALYGLTNPSSTVASRWQNRVL